MWPLPPLPCPTACPRRCPRSCPDKCVTPFSFLAVVSPVWVGGDPQWVPPRPQTQAGAWVLEGANTGTASEVCDILEAHSQALPGRGCARAICLLRRPSAPGRAGQGWSHGHLSVPHAHLWTGLFSKRQSEAAPGLEGSCSSGWLASAWPEDVFSVPGPWPGIFPSFLARALHCRDAVVEDCPRPGLGSPTQSWTVWK